MGSPPPVRGYHIAAAALIAAFGYGLASTPITGAVTDPVAGIRAQDEAVHAAAALDFARHGGWLTPRLLGRDLLYKPPLAAWLGGASLRVFGVKLWALRLPFLLATVAVCLLVFLWLRREAGETAAWAGALLLAGNPLMQVFARLAYTDMLVALAMTGALFFETPLIAGAFVATGIMAKNVAGLLPLLVLALLRVGWRWWGQTAAWAAALAAPWHVYQLVVNREWFWTEYVQRQLLAFGTGAIAMQAGEDPHWLFYSKRLLLTDPLLVIAGLAGLILLRQRREWAWAGVAVAALFAFRYRNLQYALPLLPVLAIAAARWQPRAMLALALIALPVKTLLPEGPWTLRWGQNPERPATRPLDEYAARGRGNPLVLVETDDEFYSAVLNLSRVHYYFVDPQHLVIDYAPHYLKPKITMRGEEFRRGGIGPAPQATAVVDERDEFEATVRARPDCDYYLPLRMQDRTPPATHERWGRFWLSRAAQPGRPGIRW